MDKIRANVIIRGTVQGVGFRYWTAEWAERLGLTGWIRNNSDGSVETEVEGDRAAVETYLEEMKSGPRYAAVGEYHKTILPYLGNYTTFDITR
jgi:acylphosphatase